ncbi:Myb-related protein B [Achaetomium macrosporum]|uniref:Myb-related protein B n=1 Tax=Achaetomium macrosporum TaxID=79813 RepID=A0AAN7H9R4_9PEZI|nr:Myb-related protein B [Achaetomium macrosporum]
MARARRNWTAEEDYALRKAVNQALTQSRPLLWRELAKSVPGRSNKDCRRRWWNSLVTGTTKGPWSEEEDDRLIQAVQEFGFAWTQVAKTVMTRNADQCSSHWSQVLDPAINHCDWTPTEDARLRHEVLNHGTNWATIAISHTPKRTTLALKNRYSALRLCAQNSAKRTEEQGRKSPRKDMAAAPPSADTNVADPGPATHEGDTSATSGTRQRPQPPRSTTDERPMEINDRTDSGFISGDEDEYDDAGSAGLTTSISQTALERDPLHSAGLSSAMWSDYFDRDGMEAALQPPTPPHDGMTPLTTPMHPRTWVPEVVPNPAGASVQPGSPYKGAFMASATASPAPSTSDYLGQPLFGIMPRGCVGLVVDYNGAINNIPPHPCQVDMLADPGASQSAGRAMNKSLLLSCGNMVSPCTTTTPASVGSPPADIDPGNLSRGGGSTVRKKSARSHPPLSYQVTLNMVCTSSQIEAVMTSLEAVGMSVSMKLEPMALDGAGGRSSGLFSTRS